LSFLEGVFSVLPTPFRENGDLDMESMRRVERQTVLETVLEHVGGRVSVVVGATADGLRTCIEYTRSAKAAGAAAVMISPPRMAKLNSDAVVRHFAGVADAVDIEIVVQDFPPISGFTMEPSLLARIAREIPRARTIKLEDPPTPFKTSRILEAAKDIQVRIFGGLGGVFLLEELMAGATGAMTGFAYPEILVEIVKAYRAGDVDRAAGVFYRNVALMRFEFQEGIGMAIRKEVLRRRGALDSSAIRAPGAKLDATTTAALDRILDWVRAGELIGPARR
jgi:4-hydroxy-tetrahydrodipicolinate synthase